VAGTTGLIPKSKLDEFIDQIFGEANRAIGLREVIVMPKQAFRVLADKV